MRSRHDAPCARDLRGRDLHGQMRHCRVRHVRCWSDEVTAVPPRRRQQPLHLDGAWLVTETPDGPREVPGMSVVADARGFTIAGPEAGTERTVPWAQTTGFTCQRPAR